MNVKLKESSLPSVLQLVCSDQRTSIEDGANRAVADMDDRELLARIDERTQALAEDVSSIKRSMADQYVTQDQFRPVARVVYGLVGLLLTAVVGALIALVVQGGA